MEHNEARVKRLYMRSIRRGIKEMDLIFSAYATAQLDAMDDAKLSVYDRLLSENDHDILSWITQQTVEPDQYRAMLDEIRVLAQGLTRPGVTAKT